MLSPTELIEGCIKAHPEARNEFVKRFHRNIAGMLVKVAWRNHGHGDNLEDLAQDVYVKIFSDDAKVLRSLRSCDEPSVAGLVQSVAYSVACDRFRDRTAQKRGGAVQVISLDQPEAPDVAQPGDLDRFLRSILFSEIDKVLGKVTAEPAEREVFWLYFRHGFTARDIAAFPSCRWSAKGVESLLFRLSKEIRERLASAGRPKKESKGKSAVAPSDRTGTC